MGAGLDLARRFGANLRHVRKQADLSQEEVGFRASLHRTEVGLLERGERVPRIDTLMKLAGALGVRIDCALLDGIAWNNGRQTMQAGAFTFPSPADADQAPKRNDKRLTGSRDC